MGFHASHCVLEGQTVMEDVANYRRYSHTNSTDWAEPHLPPL